MSFHLALIILSYSVFTTQTVCYLCVILTATECNCESSGSSSTSAVAAVGGVLAAVTVTAIVLLVIVIVVLMRRLNRAETCTTVQPLKRYALFI